MIVHDTVIINTQAKSYDEGMITILTLNHGRAPALGRAGGVLTGLGQHPLQALTGGFHLAWALAAGAVAVGALVTLVWLRPPARPDEVTADVTQTEDHDLAEFELEAA